MNFFTPKINWKPFFLVSLLLIIVGSWYGSRDREVLVSPLKDAELRVFVISEPSNGITEADLTPQFAKAMATHLVQKITAQMETAIKQAAIAAPSPKIRADAAVIKTQGKSLVVIELVNNEQSRAVEIIGISDKTMSRVQCGRKNLDEISLAAGPCAQKILEIHGVNFGR